MSHLKTLIGGCQCGAVRYHLQAQLKALFCCHCHQCQKQSGSAFGMAMWLLAENCDIRGDLHLWQRTTPSGKTMDCLFCPQCGTRLFHGQPQAGQLFSLKPGTLDDSNWLEPGSHLWLNDRQPWFEIKVGDCCYAEQPADMSQLIRDWQRSGDHLQA